MPTIHYISNSLLKSKGVATPQNILPPTEFSFSSLFDTADENENENESSESEESSLKQSSTADNTNDSTTVSSEEKRRDAAEVSTDEKTDHKQPTKKLKVYTELEYATKKSDEDQGAKSYPLTNISEPTNNDCLFGRGGGTNHHPGNKKFRGLVYEKKHPTKKSKVYTELEYATKKSDEDRKSTSGIVEPGPNDVISGIGRGKHVGNSTYRKLIEGRKGEYSRETSMNLSTELVANWRTSGGRFLKQGIDKLWYDIGDDKAREKTIQMFVNLGCRV